jgi:hypothetical protein
MNPTEKLELQVSEESDGGAVIALPPDMQEPEPAGQVEKTVAPQGDADDSNYEIESASSNDFEESDDDREKIRQARREERRLKKSIHKEKTKESNHLISVLKKQNEDLAQRLASLEHKTSGAELARVDKAIEDAGVQVQYAQMKMRDAVARADGDGVSQAEELLYDARRKLESLQNVKQQASKQITQQPQRNIQVPDATVQRYAADWMERNPWYDPHGRNEESEIAQMLDKRLTAEGYDPKSEDYWDELDDRLSRFMPEKSKAGQPATRTQKPRSVMTGSGKDSIGTTKSNEFRLSPDRVAAMKEAGAWNDPDKKRKMIQRFVEFDRTNKNRG